MKIGVQEVAENAFKKMLATFLMNVMTTHVEWHCAGKNFLETFKIRPDDSSLEVVLTINGVEVDPQNFFDEYEKNLVDFINQRAAELLKERGQHLVDLVDYLTVKVDEAGAERFGRADEENGGWCPPEKKERGS